MVLSRLLQLSSMLIKCIEVTDFHVTPENINAFCSKRECIVDGTAQSISRSRRLNKPEFVDRGGSRI